MIRVLVNRRRKINMAIFDRIFKKEGYLCLYEKETEMFEQLDKDFVSFLNEYDVKRYSIPAMIDGNVLAKCNYFESFPHHLSSVSTVKENRLAGTDCGTMVIGRCAAVKGTRTARPARQGRPRQTRFLHPRRPRKSNRDWLPCGESGRSALCWTGCGREPCHPLRAAYPHSPRRC